jgi:hypothetical protein
MESTFLLQLDYNQSFYFVIDVPLFKKSLCKTAFVKALEDILFSNVSEQLNYLVDSIVEIRLVDSFKILFEHFV